MPLFNRKNDLQEPLPDRTVYLIDTENVRTVWTQLLDKMTENDKIYVFYTQNSGKVSYEDLSGVLSSGKSVELISCTTGKNGLDFQLVSYLGYLIRENENADYCIISDDNGYDAVIRFWEGRDVDVSRKTAFQVSGKQSKPSKKPFFGVKKPKNAGYPAKNPVKAANSENIAKTVSADKKADDGAKKSSPDMVSRVKKLLPDEPDEKISVICDIITRCGGKNGLADIHDEIEKVYRNEKASEIYRIIRHNLNEILI